MLLYVHRNRRFIRDGSPGRPPRLSHSSWALIRLWISDSSFTQRVLNIHLSGYSVLYLLHGWCHVKLPPSRRKFCVHQSNMQQFIVLFIRSHRRRMHVCLVVTWHLHIWQNDRDLLRDAAITRGWNGYRTKSQHRKLTRRRKFSRRSCRDSNPRPFHHESVTLGKKPC